MTLFVDTSAILSVLDRAEQRHQPALSLWEELTRRRERLITSNYVLVESNALVQRRIGMEAVRILESDLTPVLEVQWADDRLHRSAVAAQLTAGERDLSLVDCLSFELMRMLGVSTAFAFDDHFSRQGFRCLP